MMRNKGHTGLRTLIILSHQSHVHFMEGAMLADQTGPLVGPVRSLQRRKKKEESNTQRELHRDMQPVKRKPLPKL